jgi:hypothetical protein
MSGSRLLSTISSQTVTLSMMTGCQANHLRHLVLSLGFIFISIHPFGLVRARRTLERPVIWRRRDQTMSWISVVPSSRCHVAGMRRLPLLQCMCASTGDVCMRCAPVHVTLGIIALCLSARHGCIVARALQSRCLLSGAGRLVPFGPSPGIRLPLEDVAVLRRSIGTRRRPSLMRCNVKLQSLPRSNAQSQCRH